MSKEQEKLRKLLTGESITGLSEKSKYQDMADELEGEEYVQFPDNTTQRVEDKKHTKGGEDMVLPNGTKILTAAIKVGAREAKKLSEDLGVKISKDDTYSKVLDKYKKRIGLRKIYDEQEAYIKEQEKVERSNADAGTVRVNQEFISAKVNDLTQKAKELEGKTAETFKTLYDMQEAKKEGKAKYQKEGMMRYGGTINPPRKKIEYKLGGKKKYEKAGEVGDPPPEDKKELKRDYGYEINILDPSYDKGRKADQTNVSGGGYGEVATRDEVVLGLQNLKTQFPSAFQSEFPSLTIEEVADQVLAEKGSGADRGGGSIERLQNKILEQQNEQANYVLKSDKFSKEQKDIAQDYLDNETFLKEELSKEMSPQQRARLLDDKFGEFTSSRFAMSINALTPEDLKKAQDADLYTLSQLEGSDLGLSDTSKQRIKEIKEDAKKLGFNPDFALTEIQGYNADTGEVDEKPPAAEEEGDKDSNIVDEDSVADARRRYPRAMYFPDQSVLPPGGLEAHSKIQNRRSRLDAPVIGVETERQAAATQRMQLSDQLRDLPPMQRAAALANVTGQLQQAENQTILGANRTNAQNLARTEMFNAQQADAEDAMAGNNLLNYEERQMRAMANTDENLRNYLDYNRKVALTNFRNTQNKNLLGTMFPDFETDFYGMTPIYNPEDPNWTAEDRSKLLALNRAMQTPDQKTKKKTD
jgi:hypothetical protein